MIEPSASQGASTQGDVLVIGYGSSLRGDDAAGLRAAEVVASWNRPGVRVLAVPQLTPELAEPISLARLVIFVDATVESDATEVKLRRLVAREVPSASLHSANPGALMALALAVYERCADGWIATIPAPDVALAERLSHTAEQGVSEATRVIARLLDEYAPAPPPTQLTG